MDHSSENLEHFSAEQSAPKEKKKYSPRPKLHLILAWALIGVVLFAFFGTCYWMINYGRA